MMKKLAELLSAPTNYAVVQLPERHFPGVVIQGDSLHNLVVRLTSVQKTLDSSDVAEDVIDEINGICEELMEVLKHYEKVCKEQGIALPYPLSPRV